MSSGPRPPGWWEVWRKSSSAEGRNRSWVTWLARAGPVQALPCFALETSASSPCRSFFVPCPFTLLYFSSNCASLFRNISLLDRVVNFWFSSGVQVAVMDSTWVFNSASCWGLINMQWRGKKIQTHRTRNGGGTTVGCCLCEKWMGKWKLHRIPLSAHSGSCLWDEKLTRSKLIYPAESRRHGRQWRYLLPL